MHRRSRVTRDQLPPRIKVILIGGTSHVGKSTLGKYLADALGWEYRTTDKLAKHPGRPWRNDGGDVPPHVRDYYGTSSSTDDLVDDVLDHYEKNVLPQINALVDSRASDLSSADLVLEGSALWPAFVSPLVSEKVGAVWLTIGDKLLVERIRGESAHAKKSSQDQLPIDRFLRRSVAFAARLKRDAETHALPTLEVCGGETIEMLAQRCLQAIAVGRA